MFFRSSLTKTVIFASAAGALLASYYYQWLSGEVAQSGFSPFEELILSTSTNPREILLLTPAPNSTIESKIRRAMKVSPKLLYGSQNSGVGNALDFYTAVLLKIYSNNAVDRCKLDTLLGFSPEFKFWLDNPQDTIERKDVDVKSVYSVESASIYISPSFYGAAFSAQLLSHEMKHAIDAFNNLQNGIAILKMPDKSLRSYSRIYGTTKGINENQKLKDYEDYVRVEELFNSDVDRISKLYTIIHKDSTALRPGEMSQVQTLNALLELYQYKQPANRMMLMDLDVSQHGEYVAAYQKNKSIVNYVPKKMIIAQHTARLNSTLYHLTRYVFQYNTPTASAYYTFSNPVDSSLLNLSIDLLSNLIFRFSVARDPEIYDNKYAVTTEIIAHIDEVLSPYSHEVKLNENVTSLRGWLFPKISAHDNTRYSKKYMECLEHEAVSPRQQKQY